MTRPTTPHHAATDPLTDSGIHQLTLGTRVRLHGYDWHIDCGLLNISNVATWADLVARITMGWHIEVNGPRRYAFAGGAVLRAECLSDPLPDPSD